MLDVVKMMEDVQKLNEDFNTMLDQVIFSGYIPQLSFNIFKKYKSILIEL